MKMIGKSSICSFSEAKVWEKIISIDVKAKHAVVVYNHVM